MWSKLPTFDENTISLTYVKYDTTVDNAVLRYKVKKVELCWQLLRLFIHMWKRGFVHCDIKPGNIGCIIVNAGTYNIAYPFIADCMQSHMHIPGGIETSINIQTPEYTAPESILAKFSGEPKIVDQGIDIFALGLVLYEILYIPRIHKRYPTELSRMEATLSWYCANICDSSVFETSLYRKYSKFFPKTVISTLKTDDLLDGLISDMLHFDPTTRITVDGLIAKIGATNLVLPQNVFTNRDIDISVSATLINIIDSIQSKVRDLRIRAITEFYAHYMAYYSFRLNRNNLYSEGLHKTFLEHQYCYMAYMYALSMLGSNIPNILIQKTPFRIDRDMQVQLYTCFADIACIYPITVNATTEKYMEINAKIRSSPDITKTDPNMLLA